VLSARPLPIPAPGQGERAEVVRHRDTSAARPLHPRSHLGAAERMGNCPACFPFFLGGRRVWYRFSKLALGSSQPVSGGGGRRGASRGSALKSGASDACGADRAVAGVAAVSVVKSLVNWKWRERAPASAPLTLPNLSFQPLELLCEKSIGTANRPMGAGEALRRVLECLASGIVMPG